MQLEERLDRPSLQRDDFPRLDEGSTWQKLLACDCIIIIDDCTFLLLPSCDRVDLASGSQRQRWDLGHYHVGGGYCGCSFLPNCAALFKNQLFEHESIYFDCLFSNNGPLLGWIKIGASMLLHSVTVGLHNGADSIRFLRIRSGARLPRYRFRRSNTMRRYKHDREHARRSGDFCSNSNPVERSPNRCLHCTWHFVLHLDCGDRLNFLDEAAWTATWPEIRPIFTAIDH